MPVPCGEYGKTETGGVRDMTRDQFIAEKVMGWKKAEGPWIKSTDDPYEAISINTVFYLDVPDWTLPRHAYALQQWVMGQEWWGEFYWWAVRWDEKWITGPPEPEAFTKWLFSSPDRFADLVAEFRGWKPLRRY